MDVLIVIPARYASSRFPGKPLQDLRGATGVAKSLVRRSWEAAMAADIGPVVVATDDSRIADAVEAFGGAVRMTPESCANGTERCAAALPDDLSDDAIVVNLQGDAPLTPPDFVTALVDALRAAPDWDMATPVLRMDAESHARFLEDRRAGRVGGTTAVFARDGRALYFSKEVIPHTAKAYGPGEPCPVFHHVGVYAYRARALRDYAGWEATPLETLEGLEQLRFLENSRRVLCVEVDSRGRLFWELNNPIDVERLEEALRRDGIE